MDLRELRIGNLVQNKEGDVFEIDNVSESGVNGMSWTDSHYGNISGGFDYMYTKEEVFGVPITEEWLVNFGFRFTQMAQMVLIEKPLGQYNEPDLRLVRPYSSDCDGDLELDLRIGAVTIIDKKIKYVHQLQNLYFALTGEELTTKK